MRTPCKHDGCGKPREGRNGYCSTHEPQFRKLGFTYDTTPLGRFFLKVNKTETCWLWTGSKTKKGYGTFWVGPGTASAHRFAYVTLVGPVPEGMQLDHLCRVRNCVNPSHLEPVTPRENSRRGLNFSGDTCRRGHSMADAYVYWIASKGRYQRRCRLCHLLADGRARARKEAA